MSYILDGQQHPWLLYTRSQEQTQYTDKKHLQTWSNISWCWGGGWDAVQNDALLRVTALETQEKQIFIILGSCVT